MNAVLTTITPVHIGSGVVFNKGIDFIQGADKLYLLDPAKVFEIIGENHIDKWVAVIQQLSPVASAKNQEIIRFLSQFMPNGKIQPGKLSSRKILLKSPENTSSQLREQFRTAMKGACIPGSSLKGAIRTTIFDHLTDQDDFKFNKSHVGFLPGDRYRFDDAEIEKHLFGKSAHEKSTRFLRIGDVQFENPQLEAHEILIMNIINRNDEWDFKVGQQFLVEAIPAGSSTKFDFFIDESLLKKNIEKNPALWPKSKVNYLQPGYSGLCKIINHTTFSLLKWELETLSNQHLPDGGEEILETYASVLKLSGELDENEFVIRVGANSGWIFTTAAWIRKFSEEMEDHEISKLRKAIQKKDYGDMSIWPKTRKVTSDGQVFGFVRVSLGV